MRSVQYVRLINDREKQIENNGNLLHVPVDYKISPERSETMLPAVDQLLCDHCFSHKRLAIMLKPKRAQILLGKSVRRKRG